MRKTKIVCTIGPASESVETLRELCLAGMNGAFVTKEDLERYGRTDVTFYKIDDEQFFMDFSV